MAVVKEGYGRNLKHQFKLVDCPKIQERVLVAIFGL